MAVAGLSFTTSIACNQVVIELAVSEMISVQAGSYRHRKLLRMAVFCSLIDNKQEMSAVPAFVLYSLLVCVDTLKG